MSTQDCSCACGAVTFSATPKDDTAGACHCGTCRKWAGGVFLSIDCGAEVSFADETKLNVWDSSPWAERVSCRTCGASLVWRTKDHSSNQVSLQAVATPDAYVVDHELFVDVKPQGYAFAGETKKFTGAEVFAMFAQQSEGA